MKTHSANPLIQDLREQIQRGNVVAIVGAGVSLATSNGEPTASWTGLLHDGIARCESCIPGLPGGWSEAVKRELASGDIDDLLSAAQKVESKLRRVSEYGRWLLDSVGSLQVRDNSVIDALAALNIPIMTTNYDGLIEKCTGLSPITWRQPSQYERVLRNELKGVIHLHGFYWSAPANLIHVV